MTSIGVTAKLFFNLTVLIGQFSLGLCLIIGLLKFNRLQKDQRILVYLIVVTTLTESLGEVLWRMKTNNLFLNHLYAVIEFVLIAYLYTLHLNGLIKIIYLRILMIAFVLFALVNTLFFQRLTEFNSNVTFTESLLLIVFSILYFYKLLRDLQHRRLERVPMFWINMSVLTYFSGALMLFHVANELIPVPLEERAMVWGTHALFNIVHYFLYGVALWVTPKRK